MLALIPIAGPVIVVFAIIAQYISQSGSSSLENALLSIPYIALLF